MKDKTQENQELELKEKKKKRYPQNYLQVDW